MKKTPAVTADYAEDAERIYAVFSKELQKNPTQLKLADLVEKHIGKAGSSKFKKIIVGEIAKRHPRAVRTPTIAEKKAIRAVITRRSVRYVTRRGRTVYATKGQVRYWKALRKAKGKTIRRYETKAGKITYGTLKQLTAWRKRKK